MEQELKQKLQDLFQKDMESASDAEIYTALLAITKEKNVRNPAKHRQA